MTNTQWARGTIGYALRGGYDDVGYVRLWTNAIGAPPISAYAARAAQNVWDRSLLDEIDRMISWNVQNGGSQDYVAGLWRLRLAIATLRGYAQHGGLGPLLPQRPAPTAHPSLPMPVPIPSSPTFVPSHGGGQAGTAIHTNPAFVPPLH